jgi:hypothetical protein
MAMTLNEAIDEALISIDTDMSESYDVDELDDPAVKPWADKKREAIQILKALRD